MPPNPAPTVDGGLGKRLVATTLALRHHDLMDLFDSEQRAGAPAAPGRAVALAY
jgi:hypothetical protein